MNILHNSNQVLCVNVMLIQISLNGFVVCKQGSSKLFIVSTELHAIYLALELRFGIGENIAKPCPFSLPPIRFTVNFVSQVRKMKLQ